ncbi:glucosyltransferase [Mortierella polycephala]|uniref:Dol-P-Glc:Glc(2)Man(9)GlcNAc(2)-PP-Dol alpha-1,2-glucosyltransferase n=1 Tax=Mortierella polycephala TaxID=41804 RepID=A0A9P6PXB3_9FUNG|nr:glucosyltransferase [Mortierella polycephala]
MVMATPYLTLLAGFGAFVRWNGGIVLGDRSNHVATVHVVQLFYFVAFASGMSIFAILGSVPIARLLKTPSPRAWITLLAIATIMTICVNKFTQVEMAFLAQKVQRYS